MRGNRFGKTGTRQGQDRYKTETIQGHEAGDKTETRWAQDTAFRGWGEVEGMRIMALKVLTGG